METFRIIYWVTICLIIVLSVGTYMLTSISYYIIAKQFNVKRIRLAFVPIVNYYLFADIKKALGKKSSNIQYLIIRVLAAIFFVLFILGIGPSYFQILTLPKDEIFNVAYYNSPFFILHFTAIILPIILIPFNYIIPCIYKLNLIMTLKKERFKGKQFVILSFVLSFITLPISIILIVAAISTAA